MLCAFGEYDLTIKFEDIEHLSKLAKLKLSDDEKQALYSDLNGIVGYIDKLSELDTSDTEPMSHISLDRLFQREDKPKSVLGNKALSESSGLEDGLIRVPKIIE